MSGFKYDMTLDELLGMAILWVAKAVLILFCLSGLVLTVLLTPDLVFPNDAGWSDLDNMEIVFYGLWALLTARYVEKARKHKVRSCHVIYRYLIAYGIHGMMFISSFSLLLYIPDEGELWFDLYSDVLEVIAELSWLAVLFAIVPKGKIPATEENARSANATELEPDQKKDTDATERVPNV